MVEQMKSVLTIEYTVQLLSGVKTVISYKSHSHSLSPKDGACSCTFQRTLLMSCRHVFKYHITVVANLMFELSLVASRWLKSYKVHVGNPNALFSLVEAEYCLTCL